MTRASLVLLPALLAFTAWAPAAHGALPVKKKAPAAAEAEKPKTLEELRTMMKTYDFKNERVVFPAYWKTSELTKTLIRSEFHYNWDKPGRECATDSFPWAYAVISNDNTLCWNPDKQLFTQVRYVEIAGSTGVMYRHNPVTSAAEADTESCPGQSYMAVVFRKYGNCYTLKFITREKFVRQFFPDFKLIMDNFQVFQPKKAAEKKGPALRQDGILQ
ncbi:MAG TPA: hypothetical protein DCZ92_00875 [Elusimicrobia bacterium]|nr:MAG: hypothetical protein A2016_04575 [Elusimicrobia bacterium GWF2_62_30]HBA59379.1 hypothetical protein [Elusimicrobiota bacterium]